MKVKVKICGIRTSQDLRLCLEAGVDAVGFNFWPGSRRYVRPEDAARLVWQLPPEVLPVGVFVRAPPREVARAVALSCVRAIQLHGDEDPSKYRDSRADLVQVLRMKREDAAGVGVPRPIDPSARYVLLDSFVEGFGGAGRTLDWSLAAALVRRIDRPVLLAGGLTPENVGEAIHLAQPWGVDVASGVESSPGVKDAGRVRAFVEAARGAAREVAAW